MINYKHLHYFQAVAKEGSIARAGERLNLTPQTISGQLGVLEDHLGAEVALQYQVTTIGVTDEVKEYFYAISIERRISNPIVSVVIEAAREKLFTGNK
jgi:hypothetical protein